MKRSYAWQTRGLKKGTEKSNIQFGCTQDWFYIGW